jgi:hypothetical protein
MNGRVGRRLAFLALVAAGPISLVVLRSVRHGPALGVFSGNAASSGETLAACAYMVAHLASWLLTPTVLLSLVLSVAHDLGKAAVVRMIARYHARSR